jgi:sugar lactone lactonase YvrE
MVTRRGAVGAVAAAAAVAALAGCAAAIDAARPAPANSSALLTPWRVVDGGFLAAPRPLTGAPAQPGSGAYVRLVSPAAIALRDNELLIVDAGAGRVYRYDLAIGTLMPIAGAPASIDTRVALGADLSAYVLDAAARRVLRFARDGRLLQTFRSESIGANPTDLALAPDGVTLYVADRTLAQVVAFRAAGAIAVPIVPRADESRVAGIRALACGRRGVYLLDEHAGAVLLMAPDGATLARFGQGRLTAPSALAVDRGERIYVAEAQRGELKVFSGGELAQTFDARALRLRSIGALASDGDAVAIADPVAGAVALFRVAGGTP